MKSESSARGGKKRGFAVADLVYIALFSVLIAVCSWLAVPSAIPFTLQTFGVFCTVGLIGGKRGAVSVIIYILLGCVGLPVFASFRSGFGVLLSPTGGYIIGFLFIALIYWVATALLGEKLPVSAVAMVVGLAVCYAFGTLWFTLYSAKNAARVSFGYALSVCVVPYILPDVIKLALSLLITKALKRYVKIRR